MNIRITALAVLTAVAFAGGPAVAAAKHPAAAHAKGSTASADNSADSLNAQSLTDAKSGTPYAPAAAPAADNSKPMMHGKKTPATKS